jgi:hypothetical protein
MARAHAQRARIALPPSPVLLTKYLAEHIDRAESAQPSSRCRGSSVDERETNEVRDLLRAGAEEGIQNAGSQDRSAREEGAATGQSADDRRWRIRSRGDRARASGQAWGSIAETGHRDWAIESEARRNPAASAQAWNDIGANAAKSRARPSHGPRSPTFYVAEAIAGYAARASPRGATGRVEACARGAGATRGPGATRSRRSREAKGAVAQASGSRAVDASAGDAQALAAVISRA